MDWIKLLRDKSEREIEIENEISNENSKYESTEAYKKHNEKITSLYEEKDKVFHERLKEFKENHPSRRRVRENPINMEDFCEKQKKRHEDWFNSLPSNVREAVNSVKGLNKGEMEQFEKALSREGVWIDEEEKFVNPKTTRQDTWELQHLLVQTTIDFLKERGLDEVDTVSFHVDGLPTSIEYGEWTPSSDSSIRLIGFQPNEGDDYPSRKTISSNLG